LILASSVILGLLGGCAPKTMDEGNVVMQRATGQLHEGTSHKQDVIKLLGSPSTKGNFGDETWYYITAHKESYAFLKPSTTQQQVMRITFDKNDMISKIENYDLSNSEDIAINKRITPTEGQKLGLWEQMLGNVGKFNKTTDAR
jgi:outer membrane protein assembly factor BamE (lipoprotein component of BamABCDE complex)